MPPSQDRQAGAAKADFLAHAIYDAMKQDAPNAFMFDEIEDGDRITIDGRFDLKQVARQVLAALKAERLL